MVGGVEVDNSNSASKNTSSSAPRSGGDMSPPSSTAGVPVSKTGTNVSNKGETSNNTKGEGKNGSNGRSTGGLSTPPPQAHQPSYQQAYLYQQLDPNQLTGYYPYQAAMSPDPNSPTTPSNRYDLQAAFLQQHQGNAAFGATNPYGTGLPQLPLSPHPSPRTTANGNGSMGVLPPNSPLFPAGYVPTHDSMDAATVLSRAYPNHTSNGTAPLSPSLSYLQTPQSGAPTAAYAGMYQGAYGTGGYAGDPKMSPSSSPQQQGSWSDRTMHQQLYQQSPQLQGQGVQVPYPNQAARSTSNHRTQSFDEMLPPSAAPSAADQNQEGYSHFATQAAAAAASSVNGTSSTPTLFAQQWGYPPSPHMEYSTQQHHQQLNMPQMMTSNYASGSQQHNARGGGGGAHMHKYQQGGAGGGHYYAANPSPGPPIQTTASNKGPDGANLFIFHIPNHFTNLDMYHLFCKYGTLLSVRIMVEKDTGRSRGFGFVSYDSPESAALAIKELNGFVIGNKRLKVQHKQIRATDHSTSSHQQSSYPSESRNEGNNNNTNNASSSSQWYNTPQSSSNPNTSAPSDDIKSDDGKSKDAVGVGSTTTTRDEASSSSFDDSAKRQVDVLSKNATADGLSQLNALRNALPDISK